MVKRGGGSFPGRREYQRVAVAAGT